MDSRPRERERCCLTPPRQSQVTAVIQEGFMHVDKALGKGTTSGKDKPARAAAPADQKAVDHKRSRVIKDPRPGLAVERYFTR